MRIDRAGAYNLYSQNQVHQKQLARIHEQLSTGKRINRASDDAAGLAISQALDAFIRGYQTASENINAGISALQIADGGSSVMMDMLQRQRELAVASSSDTLNPEQRQALDKEYQALSQEIDRVSHSTDYNGQQLLDGKSPLSDGTGKIQAGGNAGDTEDLPASDLSLASLGTGSTSIASSQGASQALAALDRAMQKVNGNRATQGAFVNRMNYAYENNQNQTVNGTKALSAILDLDYAQAMTDKVRESLISDTQTAAISQFNNLSRTHLLALLGA